MSTKRMAAILRVLSLFLLIDLATATQAVTYSFKSLDVPGAANTYAFGINDSGQVTGSFYNATGFHGFVYNGSTYTTLDVPNATFGTYAYGINDSGQVTGIFDDATGFHGFVYNGSTYTTLDVPNATGFTYAHGINDSGQVTGSFYNATGFHGFVYNGSTYTTLDDPNSMAPPPCSKCGTTKAFGINDSGQVIGTYSDYSDVTYNHVFVYNGSTYTTLDDLTDAFGINDSGQVTGTFDDATGFHGFVYNGSTYTTLDDPNATVSPYAKGISTFAFGINDSGQVTGNFPDATGWHSFIATPMTPFSAFNVTRLVIDQNRGALFLWSNFALDQGSNGINPVKADITLKIANATMTIPAGSFHKNRDLPLFAFAGQIDNVWIEALITPVGKNRFRFQALAYGAPLGDTKNPITVELTIGDDNGTTTAHASTP